MAAIATANTARKVCTARLRILWRNWMTANSSFILVFGLELWVGCDFGGKGIQFVVAERCQRNFRSASVIATSLMLANRRCMRPLAANSQFSLPWARYHWPAVS